MIVDITNLLKYSKSCNTKSCYPRMRAMEPLKNRDSVFCRLFFYYFLKAFPFYSKHWQDNEMEEQNGETVSNTGI